MAASKISTANFTEARGRQLAVDLINELMEAWDHPLPHDLPDEQIREFMLNKEPEALRRYLGMVQRNPELERGFLCLLSDFIGGTQAGSIEDVAQHYKRHCRG